MAEPSLADDRRLLMILDLRDHEALTTGEIAERMGMTRNAVVGAIDRVNRACCAEDPDGFANGTMHRKWWQ